MLVSYFNKQPNDRLDTPPNYQRTRAQRATRSFSHQDAANRPGAHPPRSTRRSHPTCLSIHPAHAHRHAHRFTRHPPARPAFLSADIFLALMAHVGCPFISLLLCSCYLSPLQVSISLDSHYMYPSQLEYPRPAGCRSPCSSIFVELHASCARAKAKPSRQYGRRP